MAALSEAGALEVGATCSGGCRSVDGAASPLLLREEKASLTGLWLKEERDGGQLMVAGKERPAG